MTPGRIPLFLLPAVIVLVLAAGCAGQTGTNPGAPSSVMVPPDNGT